MTQRVRASKPKGEDQPRERASWCSEFLVEAIYVGLGQALQYAAFKDGKVNIVSDFLVAERKIVPPLDRSGLADKGIVLLPGKPIPYGSQDALLGEVQAFISQYCDLPPFWEKLCAHYALMS